MALRAIEWINHILCLPKKKMLSRTIGKVFFSSFAIYCIASRYVSPKKEKEADDLFITSAREKNMITFVMKYAPTSYLMPLFMFRAFSSFLKLARSSATKLLVRRAVSEISFFLFVPASQPLAPHKNN